MFVARNFYRTLPYEAVDSFSLASGVGATPMMFMGGELAIRTAAELPARCSRTSRR